MELKEKVKRFEVFLVLLAILLAVLWFLNPEGNYEPILVLIGLIITFFEVLRRRATSRGEIAVQGLAHEAQENNNLDNALNPIQSSGISIEDILAGIDPQNYTGIQITQFVKRNSGIEVVWQVKVHNIKPAFEHDPESDLYLVFSPESQEGESFPEVIVAVFNRCFEGDLAAISSGDKAIIKGRVSFSELAGEYSLTLKDSELVRFSKIA
ncbi:hypothetical protein N478_00015 [Pseudoalteromonas luteoviolacea S4060-1]|uniref:Uncharacterized protein n=1 Tax=Pseudoalteromonas luteoviolacea S4060-1 TaxID=1365257 RepID=A0A161Z1M7_9GAMM|nr:hypothetical protein N478_00015 [Pseudoalteromonas luteoviolacea S4060-1]